MAFLTIVTLLAVLEFVVFGLLVGMARGKYDVQAPATTGNELFERQYRIHYNTLEQLVVFIPGLWAFGYFIDEFWGAGIGVIYIVGRIVYARAYNKDPAARGNGMLLSVIPSYLLVLGGLGAAIWSLVPG
jgi:glutathione S-transferase